MSKWITICDDTYDGSNIRTRGMAVPGGMIVQTIVTISPDYQSSAVSSVFVPDAKGLAGNQGVWLETFGQEPTGNTH